MSKRVFVCCPGDAETGGPEVLHQLVDAMRGCGLDAYILYFPFYKSFAIPESYRGYNIKVANYTEDYNSDSLVIIPEPVTKLMKFFKKSKICIWWLSVDNYYGYPLPLSFSQKVEHLKMIIKGKRKTIGSVRQDIHLVQSEYARKFLENYNIQPLFLTDYLNEVHLTNELTTHFLEKKENIVAYNPKKGAEITNDIIENCSKVKFIAIENMTPLQVKELLNKSKVYIDFGGHPGKDRFPREAAMAGCCIITGKRGSAENDIDIPINSKYKIDDYSATRNKEVLCMIEDIFDNYLRHLANFEQYRHSIIEEKALFKIQTEKFVKEYCL